MNNDKKKIGDRSDGLKQTSDQPNLVIILTRLAVRFLALDQVSEQNLDSVKIV